MSVETKLQELPYFKFMSDLAFNYITLKDCGSELRNFGARIILYLKKNDYSERVGSKRLKHVP